MLLPFIPEFPRRRGRPKSPTAGPPAPLLARIVNAWPEDELTLNVEFDQPVIVTGGSSSDVGNWRLTDNAEETIVPVLIGQTDVNVIWLITETMMTHGIVGYHTDPGALTTANGFPSQDSHAY